MLYRSVFERYLVNADKFPVNLGVFESKKNESIQFVNSQKLKGLKVLLLDFNLRPRTVEFDLRGKQGPAEKISGFHELQYGQYGGFFYSYLRFLRAKTAQITIRTATRPSPI